MLKKPNFSVVKFPAILLFIVGASLIAFYAAGYRYNATNSMPIGIYKTVNEVPKVGSVIQFCPPTSKRYDFMMAGNCPHQEASLIKEVVAVPGDVVEVKREGVYINRKLINDTAVSSRSGLPNSLGIFKLKEGEYWAFGAGNPKYSFDSRYFGLIKIESIKVLKKI